MKKIGNLTKKFGLKIKLERTKRGWSEEKASEFSKLSKQYYGAIERAESSPTLETIGSTAEAFNMKIEDLVKVDKIDL